MTSTSANNILLRNKRTRSKIALLLVIIICCAALANCQRRQINDLPRLNFEPNFNQYSGYLTSTNNRRLFYWLVESSQVSPSEAPLMLWLNGGPGCSSIGGLLMTNGPFLANDRAELDRNDLAWNRLANMLYIDSPNGVGLSESGPINQSVLNDQVTTELNLGALVHFFSLFPEYRARPFYITGESYAGIYIPLLAHAILRSEHYPGIINLKGIAVGNGVHVPRDFKYIFQSEFKNIMGLSFGDMDLSDKILMNSSGIRFNPYNIANTCNQLLPESYPCLSSTGLLTYLNNPKVRRALGINNKISDEFKLCRLRILSKYERIERDVLPELTALAQRNISVLLYHGNLDYVIPTRVTQILLEQLALNIPENAYVSDGAWFYCFTKHGSSSSSLQIGGLQKSYMRGMIRYRTVIGAGHSVATDRPDMAFQILKDLFNFNNNNSLKCSKNGSNKVQSRILDRGLSFYGFQKLISLLKDVVLYLMK